MIRKIAIVYIFCSLLSCAATPDVEHSDFYASNYDTFFTGSLTNGIPVIIKKNTSNQIVNIQIIVDGGSSCVPTESIGIEQAVFDMLSRGSTSYSYDELRSLCYKKQASISGSSGADYSLFSLNCIDYYFDSLFPVFADCFLNPAFVQKEFDVLCDEYRQSLQSTRADPFSLLQKTIHENVYANHPYWGSRISDESSIDMLSVQQLVRHHGSLLNASRISIVAVGNFDQDKLIAVLNDAFGSLPSVAFEKPAITIPDFSGAPVTVATDSSRQTAYCAVAFPIPENNTREYAAFALAANTYDDILFNIVREKHGSCYSVGNGAGMNGSHAPYGMLYVFKVSDTQGLPDYLHEAADIMDQGNVLLAKTADDGEYEQAPLVSKLDGYKNSYINQVFSGLRTNSGVASRIVSGYMMHQNPARYLEMIDIIRSITAEEVTAAYRQYWQTAEKRWFFVSDTAGLSDIPVSQYP